MEAYLNTFIDGKTDKFDGSAFEIKQSYLATSIKGTYSYYLLYIVLMLYRYNQSIRRRYCHYLERIVNEEESGGVLREIECFIKVHPSHAAVSVP